MKQQINIFVLSYSTYTPHTQLIEKKHSLIMLQTTRDDRHNIRLLLGQRKGWKTSTPTPVSTPKLFRKPFITKIHLYVLYYVLRRAVTKIFVFSAIDPAVANYLLAQHFTW